MSSRTFASDNNSGAHPAVLAAIAAANAGHVHAYGYDPWTDEAVATLRGHVGDDARVYFVFNGTGANVTALSSVVRPGQAVLCPATAHVNTDECGAPEYFLGAKVMGLPTRDGKLTVESMEPSVRLLTGVEHHAQPRVASISQVAETGVVYSPDEVRALADYCHGNGMLLHMDGARVANAAASLALPIRAFTTDAGVDMLSFGGTKNGMLFGEAVCFLTPGLGEGFKYVRKVGSQLASKMRFVSSQFTALYAGDLWLELADHANAMASRLEIGARAAGVGFAYPVAANELFPVLPTAAVPLLQAVADFYEWDVRADGTTVARWVCSWDTTEDDVDRLCEALHPLLG